MGWTLWEAAESVSPCCSPMFTMDPMDQVGRSPLGRCHWCWLPIAVWVFQDASFLFSSLAFLNCFGLDRVFKVVRKIRSS